MTPLPPRGAYMPLLIGGLLLASLCQLRSGAVANQPGLGMGAPLPLSWEAAKPFAVAAAPASRPSGAHDHALAPAPVSLPARLVHEDPVAAVVERQLRLLLWGRLLLEGG